MIRKPRRPRIIFIVGPTAVGKTAAALAVARRTGGEIVSCDSMQVYKGMPIISQAPSAGQRRAVRHHLVAVVDPRKEFSVAAFRKRAIAAIERIVRKGKVPVVAGGTGLYAKALIDGLFPSPKADTEFRRRCERYARRHGADKLYARLVKVDPDAARSIHPNDVRRVTRALEIFRSTGKTMTRLKAMTKGLADRFDVAIFGLTAPRQRIYEAIDSRVDRMFDDGLVAEVRRLRKRRVSRTASMALGFGEVAGYLDGEYDLGAAKEMLKMNTRRFAKRQLAWFRADGRIRWADVSRSRAASAAAKIARQAR